MSRAGVQKRQHKRVDGSISTTYTARLSYRDGDGTRKWDRSRSFRTRKEAEAEYVRMRAAHDAGTYTAPSSMTVREYVESHWLPSIRSRVKRSTFTSYEKAWTRHLRQDLGGFRLQALTPSQIDTVYQRLGEERTVKVRAADGAVAEEQRKALKPKTIHNIHLALSKALSDAVDAGFLATNPAERAKPPKVTRLPENEVKVWTEDQLKVFLAHIEQSDWHAHLRVSSMTGMRRGEVLGLRWSDIDFDTKTLTVRQNLLARGYETTYFDTPKNHRSRAIAVDDQTLKVLKRLRAKQNEAKLLAGDSYLASDLCFTREDGSLTHPDTFSQAFDRLSAQVDGLPRIALKDLRHTHATLLLRQGVSIKVVSERLGHADPGFTLRTYAHVLPTMQADAAAGLAAIIDQPASSAPTRGASRDEIAS